MDTMLCDKCGGIMEHRIIGSTQGWHCLQCDWSIVTSFIDPIKKDQTDYSVYITLSDTDKVTIEQMKIVALITGKNLVDTKRSLKSHRILLKRGKATEVMSIIERLSSVKLEYNIEPHFPY